MRQPHEGLSSDHWAEAEFGCAPLADARLSTRLVKSASLLSDVVGHAIVAHTDHDAAVVKGHYRLLESAEDSEVRPENILAPHRARTIERMRSQKEVLFIQDGTKLNYATRPACEGLQIIGSNQTKAKTRGLPLGVLRCSWRDPQTGPLAPRSQQWLDGYLDICQAAEGLSRKSRLICIMHREADHFALFDAQRRQGRVEMLVRVRQDRVLAKGRKMYATLRSAPVDCTLQIEIQSVTARPKSSRKKERVGRSYRMAHAEVRFQRLELRATQKDMDPVTMYGVHVRETAPPPGQKPVEWYLLTSMELHTAADAVQMLDYYTKRWRIEDFFRVLKSGCKVESLALRTALPLERPIAIYCVIAWRIMVLTLLGRTVPRVGRRGLFYGDGAALFVWLRRPGAAATAPDAAGGYPAGGRAGRLPEPQPGWPCRLPDHVAWHRPTEPDHAGIRSGYRTVSVLSIIDGSLHGEASRDQILCYGTGIGLPCMGQEWPFVCFTRGMNLKASQSDPSVQICVVCRTHGRNKEPGTR